MSPSPAHSLTGRSAYTHSSPAYVQPSAHNGSASKTTTYKHADVKVASVTQEVSAGGVAAAYGGAAYGRYMAWYWLIWVFLIPVVVFVLMLVFPPSWVLECGPNNTQVVNLTKVLGLSVFVGLLIVLIFWFIAAWC